MAKVDSTKIRILAVAKIINEGRRVTASDIIRILDMQYDIQVDRKTIYSDICCIDRFIPITSIRGRFGGYQKFDFRYVVVGIEDGN